VTPRAGTAESAGGADGTSGTGGTGGFFLKKLNMDKGGIEETKGQKPGV